MGRDLLRLDVARGLAKSEILPLDREEGVIRGFAVVTKGIVESHKIEFDDASLDKVVELGAASKVGIKSRFGHRTMSAKAEGTELGRAKNFRRDGDIVRADLHMYDAAKRSPNHGNMRDWVLDMAEEDPDAFGSSMVVDGDLEWRLEKDGTKQKGPDGNDLFPLFRPAKLWFSDIVNDPAANEGLFSKEQKAFFSADVELSAAAQEFLDQFLQKPEAVEAALGFLRRYESQKKPRTPEKESKMPEDTKAASGGAAQLDAAEITKKALEGERARVKGLREAAFDGQDELLGKAIDEAWSLEQGVLAFNKEMRGRLGKRLTTLQDDHAAGLAPTTETKSKLKDKSLEAPIVGGVVNEEAAKAKWAAMSASDRSEYFSDYENYKAHLESVAEGAVRGSLAEVD